MANNEEPSFLNDSRCPERLKDAYNTFVYGKKHISKSPYQRPTFLLYPELTAKPWHDPNDFSYLREFEKNFKEIQQEFVNIFQDKNSNFDRIYASVESGGTWTTFYFLNQGEEVIENCKKCPKTWEALSQSPIMKDCGLGYAYFSILKPGTHITPHCGPVNARLRVHLGIEIPENCEMRIATEKRKWEEGKILIFDDSYEHEVWHNGNSDSKPRVVLLFDVWHPELSEFEKEVVKTVLPKGDD